MFASSGVDVSVLTVEEEARLAFAGATGRSRARRRARSRVVDVGGGSTEIVCGTATDGVSWSTSFRSRLGLRSPTRYLHGDPPSASELAAVREQVAAAFAGLEPPAADGGLRRRRQRASLRRVVGEVLDQATLERGLAVLAGASAKELEAAAPAAPRARPRAAGGVAPARWRVPRAAVAVDDRGRRPARGRDPGAPGADRRLMAKAAHVPLDPQAPFAEAAAVTVRVRTGELFAQAAGVLDVNDIEAVHDMRVATRRLRAVLEIFAPCFPAKRLKPVLRDVKLLADALGARRDPDVRIEELETLSNDLGVRDLDGVRSLLEQLRMDQAIGNARLAAALDDAHNGNLASRLLALAERAR